MRGIYTETSLRLQQEISALANRGILNLFIGVVTSFLAVGFLISLAFGTNTSISTVNGVLEHYIPRVLAVVFIEVFSFFFLKLYRDSLSEIKYYQNELTDMAQQRVALEVAQHGQEPSLKPVLAEALMGARRNSAPEGQASNSKAVSAAEMEELLPLLGKIADTLKK